MFRHYNVVAVASNKGGVGKTSIASNLPIFMSALREDLLPLPHGLAAPCYVLRGANVELEKA